MPMMVATHAAKEVLSRSVGENAWPSPWLSVGASVRTVSPEAKCVLVVRNGCWYDTM